MHLLNVYKTPSTEKHLKFLKSLDSVWDITNHQSLFSDPNDVSTEIPWLDMLTYEDITEKGST